MADSEHIILYETPVYGRPDRNPLLWHGSDFVANEPFPGNPHFVGPFTSTRYARPLLSQAMDIPPAPLIDVPTYFIARFQPVRFLNDRALFEQPPKDLSSALKFETNTHFIAQFKVTTYGRATYPQPTDAPSILLPDAPMYFIAAYRATKLFNDRRLFEFAPQDRGSTLKFETNVHFIAPYIPTKYKVDLSLGQFASLDGQPLPPPSDVQHIWAFGLVKHPL